MSRPLSFAKRTPLHQDYDIGRQLGTGKFSVVKLIKEKKTGKEYAVKMITKKISENEEVMKEIEVMKAVSEHPGVIHLSEVYEDDENYNLVIELVTGGELFDKIVEYEFYTEKDAAGLIRQIASFVNYLHSRNIVHRDLKPENLLFENEKAERLKLCDFGLADWIQPGEHMSGIVGSPTYMAPEILDGDGYGKPVDLYSVGVIMYILLCGYPPFEPEEGIVDLDFPSPEWDLISKDVKQIITLLLSKDPAKRPTAEQLLAHQWITGETASAKSLTGTIRVMKTFNTVRRNPGETMRKKDAASKGTVFSLFDNPNAAGSHPSDRPAVVVTNMASPRDHGHINSAKPKALEDAKKKDEKEKKKNRRKTATVIRPSDIPTSDGAPDSLAARMGFTFGEQSLRDISKKMAELNVDPRLASPTNAGTTSPRGSGSAAAAAAATAAAAELAKEHAKLKDMYNAERAKKKEADDKAEGLTKELNDVKAKEAAAQKKIAELEALVASQKATVAQLQDTKTTLELDVKKANRETSDQKIQADKAERKARAYEEDYVKQSAKVKELTAKVTNFESLVKIENVVAERLESKKIKELEQKLATLESDAKSEAEMRQLEAKQKSSLEFLKKKLEAEVADLKKQLDTEIEEKTILRCKLEAQN